MTRKPTSPRRFDVSDPERFLLVAKRFRIDFVSASVDLKTYGTFLLGMQRAFSAEVVADPSVVLPPLAVTTVSEYVNLLISPAGEGAEWAYDLSLFASRNLGVTAAFLVAGFHRVAAGLIARLEDAPGEGPCRSSGATREFARLRNQLREKKGEFAFRISGYRPEERWSFST